MSLAPPKPSPLAPGYRLDRYELLCPIAEGGMASVWVARLQGKHGFERLVAIKMILQKYASDLRFQQMFLDEARIAASIEHANVARILDLGEEHDVLYLVMEWVDGDALSKLTRAVQKKALTIPQGVVLRVLADTCGGLHAAHELRAPDGALLGVVHRDVSPQNILVTARGVTKLIDFGIAKARDRVAGDTNTGLLKGKLQYMAPEQALGKAVDRRADIWAIGSILYQLLAGRPPFEGENQLATLHMLTSGKPPLPLPPTVPAPVAAVVRRALTHDPAKRFATAEEMQAAIESAMVEAKLTTTVADVAAFTTLHVAGRAEARRQAVELALSAAGERVRMQALLKPPSADSSTGLSAMSPRLATKSISDADSAAVPTVPRATESVSAVDTTTVATVPPPRPPSRREPESIAPADAAHVSEISSATLGSAALSSPLAPPPNVASRHRTILIALGAAAVAVAAIATVVAGRAGHGTAVASPPPSVAALPAATVSSPSSVAVTAPPPEARATIPSAPAESARAEASATASAPSAASTTSAPPPVQAPSAVVAKRLGAATATPTAPTAKATASAATPKAPPKVLNVDF